MLQHKQMSSNISDIYLEEIEEYRESEKEQDVTQLEEKTTLQQ